MNVTCDDNLQYHGKKVTKQIFKPRVLQKASLILFIVIAQLIIIIIIIIIIINTIIIIILGKPNQTEYKYPSPKI